MARTIYMSLFDRKPCAADRWDGMELDAALEQCIDGESVRNEWPSEHGDSAGEVFATLENWAAPDGCTYHVLFDTDWCNTYAPWTSDSTSATLYNVANAEDMAEWARDVAEWEAKPETDPDYEDETDDDDSEDDEPNYQVVVGNIGTVYDGPSLNEAEDSYSVYVGHSTKSPGHRCYGEPVSLLRTDPGAGDQDIIREYPGHDSEESESHAD